MTVVKMSGRRNDIDSCFHEHKTKIRVKAYAYKVEKTSAYDEVTD